MTISLLQPLVLCLLASVCLAAHFVRFEDDSVHRQSSPFARRSVGYDDDDDDADFEQRHELARRSLHDDDVYHRPLRRSVYDDKSFDNLFDSHVDMDLTRRDTNPAAMANEWHHASHTHDQQHPSAGADFAHHQHTSGEHHDHDRRDVYENLAEERAHRAQLADLRSRRHLVMPGGFYGGYGYPAFGYPGFYGGYGYPGYGGLYFRRRREIPHPEASISPVSPVYFKTSDTKLTDRLRRSNVKISPFDRIKKHQRRQVAMADPMLNGGYVGASMVGAPMVGAPVVGAPYMGAPMVGVDPYLAGGALGAPAYVPPGYGAGMPMAGVL